MLPLSLDLNSVFSDVYEGGESFSLVLMLARYASHCQTLLFPLIQKIHLFIYAFTLITVYTNPKHSANKFIISLVFVA